MTIGPDGQSAMRPEPERVTAVIKAGKVVITVNLPDPESVPAGNLSGQVVDGQGRPIEGAVVAP